MIFPVLITLWLNYTGIYGLSKEKASEEAYLEDWIA
jgi:hypothetical protein